MNTLGAAKLLIFLIPAAALPQTRVAPRSGYREWSIYGGGFEQMRYSALAQINRQNAHRLEVAWTYDTGDASPGSEMQCNPIVAGDLLYGTTPKMRVFALNAATGKQVWRFDPHPPGSTPPRVRNRGVTYWADGDDRRIFFTSSHYLYALDARTGELIQAFGSSGRVDMREHLGRDPAGINIRATTPGVIYKDMIIMGNVSSEGLPAAPGDIRAFDVRSGKLRWRFRTIPYPGDHGHDTWPADAWKYTGAANNWAGMSVDVKRGIVFAPTGSAAFDFYGSNRAGDNLFANCLLALKADTGERLWHFQMIKHDVWDRDLPAPPTLVTVRRQGKTIDAVAQITKSGHVFVFERETGKSLFPIEYREVPASEIDGEVLAKTQPFPLAPVPFARQWFTPEMATKRTSEANRVVVERLRKVRSAGQFVPPSLEGTVIFPGFDGGGEWGGSAFDPATGLLYVNSNEMPWILRLVPRGAPGTRTSGRALYNRNCAGCHREDLGGSPPEFPSLTGIAGKLARADVLEVSTKGRGRMPGFAHLGERSLDAITTFLISGEDRSLNVQPASSSPFDLKYTIDGYNKFLDPDGYPAVEPPWGTLNAINLDTGAYAWKIPFGEFPELAAKGLRNTGTENYGGPVVTAGGVLFIGATNHDRKFHVYDKGTGKLLWEYTLPAAGNATPAVYEVGGRQFVVIAAGGGKSGAPSGGAYVAFALPK